MTRGRRGYTLVEVVVACSILSVVFLVVTNLLRQTRVFSQRVDTRGAAQEDALLTLRRLVDDVAQAGGVVAPRPNADGSPRTKSYLVYRDVRHAVVMLSLDPGTRTLNRSTVLWSADGTSLTTDTVSLGSSPFFEEIFFTVAATSQGTNVRVALRTTGDWFFEGVTPWCTHH